MERTLLQVDCEETTERAGQMHGWGSRKAGKMVGLTAWTSTG